MEAAFVISILLLVWLLIAPILGLIGFFTANAAKRDALVAQREIEWLRGQLRQGSDLKFNDAPNKAAPPPTPAANPPVQAKTKPEKSATTPLPAAANVPTPQPFPKPVSREKRDFERMIAANWIVWAGGLALAIGGLFLVRVAIDAGLFGPMARVLMATLFGGGLIAAAFKADGLKLVKDAKNGVRFLPHILAAAGITSLFGAGIGAGLLYGLVSPFMALGLIVLVSALAVALSLRFGPVLAALGLTGAYVAPLLTGSEGGSVLPLLPYFAAITGAGLTLVRLKGWRFLSWLSLTGAGIWGVIAVLSADIFTDAAVPAYALALAVMGLFFGARDAKANLSLPNNGISPGYIMAGLGESQLAAHMFWLLSGGLILLTGWAAEASLVVTAALVLYCGLGLFASWRRAGYALITPLAALATTLCLILWSQTGEALGYTCFAAAIAFGLAAPFVMAGKTLKAPIAAAGALMPPIMLFLAFWRVGEVTPHIGWGFVALALACALGMLLEVFSRRPDCAGAAAAYALGAVLSAALAPFLMLSGLWLGAAMAVVALGIAVIMRRFDLPLIRLAGPVAAGLGTALLIRPGMLSGADISATPILNEMTFGFVIAIAAIAGGAWMMRAKPVVRRGYTAAALILTFGFIGLTIRHIAGGGDLNGPWNGIGEASGYVISYLGMVATFAWRFGRRGWVWRVAEYGGAALGLGGVGLALVQVSSGDVGSMPVANLLLPAFALPAILLAVYASGLRHAARMIEGRIMGALAMLIGFGWVSFEVARSIGGPQMQNWYGDLGWAYSPAWIAYAFALLFWGVWKQRISARFASLGILSLALLKVFVVDMGALEGVARAGSFIGLGIALLCVALYYQRFVFANGLKSGSPAPQTSV